MQMSGQESVAVERRRRPRTRGTHEVFSDHLALMRKGDVEADIRRNFAEDCVILTAYGVFHGHEGCRQAARLLHEQLGAAQHAFSNLMWHGELAFLEWTARGDAARIDDGTHSYWIRDGRIQAMTIHYTVLSTRPH
jgi:hypothetical protein